MNEENPEKAYWNEEGGARWVANIERVESMLSELSDHLVARAAARPGEHVLDIGCGGGVTSAALADGVGETGNVVGADISEVILEVARDRYRGRSNLTFTTADAGTHPFPEGSFDLITSRFGVMFFPQPEQAFANIRKAGKRGGRIVFMCWRPIAENPWMGAAVAAAFTVLPRPEKPDLDAPGPFSLSQPEKIERILAGAGFDDISISPVDEDANLGALDLALDFLTKMGPAAEPLKEASASDRSAAIAAMRGAMEPYDTDNGVVMGTATWLVEASIK